MVNLDEAGRRNTAIINAIAAEAIAWRERFLAWIEQQKERSHEAITPETPMHQVLAVDHQEEPGVLELRHGCCSVLQPAPGATGELRLAGWDRTTSLAPGEHMKKVLAGLLVPLSNIGDFVMPINLSDLDGQAEADELDYQRLLHVASQLDLGDVLAVIGEAISGENLDTPLSDLLEEWTRFPEPDWQRPVVSGSTKERIGDYVVRLAATIMARHLYRAKERSLDVNF
jgi:hypothetical protein